ncbi:hypothetical protein V7S43_002814 [Phytophthora oleae]|uniref:Uncharacterized protein n=1 Tax=Phytophthora oleae TaxID=2107226 RepID=A0ABD3G0S4_9STRA
MYRTLDREAQQELVLAVKAALRLFIDEVLDVRLSIEPSFTETTPKAIILACNEDFATILSVHQARLSATFGPEVISMIWAQRKDLKEEYYDQRNIKNKVDR